MFLLGFLVGAVVMTTMSIILFAREERGRRRMVVAGRGWLESPERWASLREIELGHSCEPEPAADAPLGPDRDAPSVSPDG